MICRHWIIFRTAPACPTREASGVLFWAPLTRRHFKVALHTSALNLSQQWPIVDAQDECVQHHHNSCFTMSTLQAFVSRPLHARIISKSNPNNHPAVSICTLFYLLQTEGISTTRFHAICCLKCNFYTLQGS